MNRNKLAVGIIIKENKILLLKRANTRFDEGKWCAVNETMEEGESPEQTIIRGIKEEINSDLISHKFLFEHPEKEFLGYIFLCKINEHFKLNNYESSEFGWFTFEEAMNLDLAFDYRNLLKKIKEKKLF